MGNGKWALPLIVIGVFAAVSSDAHAGLLYASATMGGRSNTGQAAYQYSFTGVRFTFPQPAVIDGIGGNMYGLDHGNRLIFGAIVRLSNIDDLPDSNDLSTPDVLGHALFTPPSLLSDDIFVPISPIAVPAGAYALIYGSGLFGATGFGAIAINGTNIGPPTMILYTNGQFLRDYATGMRLTVYGTIPEPSVGVALLSSCAIARRREKSASKQE